MDNQTQVLENLQDIKELSENIADKIYDPELMTLINRIYSKAHTSIELIYHVQNIQLINPKYEFSPPQV